MFEHLPLHSVNVRIWIFLGFLQPANYRRAICFSFLPVLSIICIILKILLMWQGLQVHLMSFFVGCILFNALVRILTVVLKKQKFVRFMKDIGQMHLNAERKKDSGLLKILQDTARRAHLITKSSLILSILGSLMAVMVALLQPQRRLLFDVYAPGLDVLKSPLYDVIFVLQTVSMPPYVICTYITFNNLFLSWLLFGIGALKNLQQKIEGITGKDDEAMIRELKHCIRYHKKIIKFRDDLNELVSMLSFIELAIFSIMLCVLLFFTSSVNETVQQIAAMTYILLLLYLLFICYWYTNAFSSESLKVAHAAYSVDWIHGNKELRKYVLIMIARSQNALQISAGGLYPMTLDTFQAVLNASYSYFTLLNGLNIK